VSAPRTLAEAIRRRRHRKRLSLRAAAAALSALAKDYPIGATLLHGWERGRTPGRRYLQALADWLGLPPLTVHRLRRAQLRRDRLHTANPTASCPTPPL
jgi:transcriptional regulator with XRE-family HTH domain